MLVDAVTDAAIAIAKRHSHIDVTRAHVLAALLTCKGVLWPQGSIPAVDLNTALGPDGTAIRPPVVSAEMLDLINRCSTPETAQGVAREIITQMSTIDIPATTPTAREEAPAADAGSVSLLASASQSTSAGSVTSASQPLGNQVVARAELLRWLSMCIERADSSPVLLHGRSGAGRTTILRTLAKQLHDADPDRTVRHITARDLLTNPDSAMALSKSMIPGAVFLLDDADLLLGLGSSAFGALSVAVSALLASGGPTVVLAIPTAMRGRFEMSIGRLAQRCTPIEVPPLFGPDLEEAIGHASQRLAAHHNVSFTSPALRAAAAPPGAGETSAQPGLGISRLDIAGAAVAQRVDRTVGADDVVLGQSTTSQRELGRGLRDRLVNAVLGQEHAVDRLVQRLRITQAGFDLRPERPDGVFLFVGPTGVGKTALARSLALELFGAETNLIRLDMSEYSEPWAISRLIGPQPGYVGSTEPESWLTTKVRNNPHSVVLLDEIEKAHPDVWNVFLQVFDGGRLTDSKGETADFSSTIVIMTSNLGTGLTERSPMGFNASRDDDATGERRVMEVVGQSMRPELLNRIDSSVVFHALDAKTIGNITRAEIGRLASTLGPRGYLIQVDDDAIEFVAKDGYDAKFGARHVQRAIEHRLLEPLIELGPGRWATRVTDDGLVWEPAS